MPRSPRPTIEWALPADAPWLIRHDPHVSRRVLRAKIARSEVLVARERGRIVGWLRFCLFLDTVPFIVLLFVMEKHRGRHIGSGLVHHFERRMKALRFSHSLVSSGSRYQAQHFWRRLGYKDIGAFAPPWGPFEILFCKKF